MYDDSKDMYNLLVELLWETNKTKQAIAAEMGITLSELQKRIKYFGLDWIRSSSKKMSRGQQALTQIMRKIMPGEEIVNEYHIGERLMLMYSAPSTRLRLNSMADNILNSFHTFTIHTMSMCEAVYVTIVSCNCVKNKELPW